MERPLAFYGDPLLRRKSTPVDAIDDEIRQLVADMMETMYAHRGCGISAIQIKVPLRICIVCPDVIDAQGNYIEGKPRVLINPKLSDPSPESEVVEEGCLSIPGVYGIIRRPVAITVEALNLAGDSVVERFHHLPARIVMHENDHLNGVLMIDRFEQRGRRHVDALLRELKKKQKK